jgi:hypothetical protein
MQDHNLEQLDDSVPIGEPMRLPKHLIHFKVGELLPWKGIWFEVTELTVEGLVLKARKPIEKKHETL